MTNVYILNNHPSAALNLLQFLLDNGCKITLDEEARSCLPEDLAGRSNAAKAAAYYEAICEMDGIETISYKGAGYRGWVQFAIGWGNKDWEEVADWSCPSDDDAVSLIDIWSDSYQRRIGDPLCEGTTPSTGDHPYRVTVTETISYVIEVEADDSEQAQDKAEAILLETEDRYNKLQGCLEDRVMVVDRRD